MVYSFWLYMGSGALVCHCREQSPLLDLMLVIRVCRLLVFLGVATLSDQTNSLSLATERSDCLLQTSRILLILRYL